MRVSEKIFYNINESDIFVEYLGLKFYFSSEFNYNRFLSNVLNYIENEKMKNNIKYKVEGNFDRFYAISFYKKIEKRGFRIENNLQKFKELKFSDYIESGE